jgi:hypothetical protein
MISDCTESQMLISGIRKHILGKYSMVPEEYFMVPGEYDMVPGK